MTTDNQIRNQIVRRIRKIPSERLNDLADYLDKLEQTTGKPAKILSFAGCWSDIEDSAFNDLTENLLINRQKNTRRFDE
ncbi:MAG: hypothetical protein Q8910_17945 [Bacteroidota bacterium]|nr:hypothetical protein [Bacteroidota bacterium]